MWGFSAESWREWCLANDLDPDDIAATMTKIQESAKFICAKCTLPLDNDEIYVQVEPPPPLIVAKYLHGPCLLQYLAEYGEELSDSIMCLIYGNKR